MNTNTGQIYEPAIYPADSTAMAAAIDRGEPVVEVSRRVAKLMKEALKARAVRARSRCAMQKASRRQNR